MSKNEKEWSLHNLYSKPFLYRYGNNKKSKIFHNCTPPSHDYSNTIMLQKKRNFYCQNLRSVFLKLTPARCTCVWYFISLWEKFDIPVRNLINRFPLDEKWFFCTKYLTKTYQSLFSSSAFVPKRSTMTKAKIGLNFPFPLTVIKHTTFCFSSPSQMTHIITNVCFISHELPSFNFAKFRTWS